MKELTIYEKMYPQFNTTFICVYTHSHTYFQSLVGRGDNGGVTGEYVTVVNATPHRHVNIRGIGNHKITSVPIYTVGDLAHSQAGPVIIIMHQYAYHGKGDTVHYSVQLEWYKNEVNYISRKVNDGEKLILNHEGYVFPPQFS